MEGLKIYEALSRPPQDALKKINGGRLNGKSDINPQWRYRAMTEKFGLCGIGWKFTIDRVWPEQGADGQVFAWAQVSIYIKDGEKWSDPIPGIGGNYLVEKESKGLHSNDEGYKMAVTDALGTAMKMIGVAASVYEGKWDGAKYAGQPDNKLQEWVAHIETATTIDMLKNFYLAAVKEYQGNTQAIDELVRVKEAMKAKLGANNATA